MPRRLWRPLAAVGVAAMAAATVGVTTYAASAATTSRIAGSSRYETAAAVSASQFAPGVAVAFVATGTAFPDALAGGPAAAALHGPVLLTEPSSVPPATADELKRLTPGRIVVLGGPAAVSDATLSALQAYTSGTVTRLSGTDRYATAAAISQAAFPSSGLDTVYVTTGTGFADALAAGPIAGMRGVPVLLVQPDAVPTATADELRRLAPKSITILGGAAVVGPAAEDALHAFSGTVTRIGGADRFITSSDLSRSFVAPGVSTVFLATGLAFPDALAAGPVGALTPGPLMLVPKDCVPPSVDAEIRRLGPQRIVLLGGTGAVGSGVAAGTVCSGSAPVDVTTSGGPDRTAVVEAPDFAGDAFADPWDYSNSEDVHVGTPQMSDGGTISGGLLSYTGGTSYPWMDPLPYLPGSTPLDRDGPRNPIDTATYTHLSVRLYVSENVIGQISWATCDWSKDKSCTGAMGVPINAGWHIYDWKLASNTSGAPAAWSGRALMLRFLPANKAGVQIKVDWMRLHGTAAPMPFTFAPAAGGSNEVIWDTDTDPSNNVAGAPGWGSLGTVSGTTASLPYDELPPGSYRLYARSGGTNGPYTAPLTVVPRPRLVIDSPGPAGGDDWATTVRHNPWDFAGLDDVGRQGNMCNATIVSPNVLSANNCGSEVDNPFFFLPNPAPIDGSTWHHLTLRMRYDGPFGLNGGPTGGSVARLIWYPKSNPGADQNIDDLVVYPGWQTIHVDLETNPPSAIVDSTQQAAKIGWAGQVITSLRLDPNEDVSQRHWYVDDVRISRDVVGHNGQFTLRLHDATGLGGQTATVYLDKDRSGFDGTSAGTFSLSGGDNTLAVTMPGSLANGTYYPYVVVSGAYGPARRYADTPIALTR